MCSAKLERWAACGFGLELIFSAGGGGERPMEDVELLSDCSGEGVIGVSFFPFADSAWSAMVEGACWEVRGARGSNARWCGLVT